MPSIWNTRRPPLTSLTTVALVSLVLGACDSGSSISGPQGEACGAPPYFTVLPADADEITAVSVFGGLGAPGHTLPTAHGGYDLVRNGVPLRSPGDIAVTQIRRVTYTSSSNREGVRDYAIFFQVCRELTGWWGHVASLAPAITSQGLNFGDCETYSTPIETVEACTAETGDLKVAAGAPLGTGGIDVAAGFAAVDFGMLDGGVNNRYVSPWRYPNATFHALERCRGHVLDIGAGTGLHSLVLQSRGLRVTAIDVSPQALMIMREAGVDDVRRGDILEFEAGPFDTLLMLGHGIGMVEDLAGLDAFLMHARGLVSGDGQMLVHSNDVRKTDGPTHLAYHGANRRAGRYIGEIRMQFVFEDHIGPLCGWLHVDPETLERHAERSGWACEAVMEEEAGDYLARLTCT